MQKQKLILELNQNGMLFDKAESQKLLEMKRNQLQQLEAELAKELKIAPSILNDNPALIKSLYNANIFISGLSMEVLKAERFKSPILEKLYQLRKIYQFLFNYGKKLSQSLTDENRLYGHWKLNGTVSGRLTCSDFNIQSVHNSMKPYFIAEKGSTLIISDFSQIELRVLAELSQDARLIGIFKNGGDYHAQTASILFGKPQNTITEQERSIAKRLNFAICYGVSTTGLEKLLIDMNISTPASLADMLRDRFYSSFLGVKNYQNSVLTSSLVKDLSGRQWNTRNLSLSQRLNYPIQASAAAIMLESLLLLMQKKKENWKIVNVIHDELICEVPVEEQVAAKTTVIACMRDGFEKYIQGVPFKAETVIRNRWKPLEEERKMNNE
ncbi:hypothetical protein H5P36_23560 [Bacillus sp. APMAM]|nr:hypothetical protein [Bacillus sp. APMAM]RTZ53452.1 hypothetical protein EKO25_23325 [Bacillus sp. SAJ1]